MKEKKKLNQNTFLLLVTILLFFVMYAIGCVLFNAQGFAKTQNFLNLFISNAGLIVIGIGMTIVMITGGIDISVGSFVAMGCMMLAWMMEKGGIGAVPAVLIVLVTGIVFGLVQGFLVAYMDIQPFIVTLAGMFFARGMTAIISKDLISITNETFMAWAKMKLYIPFGGYLNKKGDDLSVYLSDGCDCAGASGSGIYYAEIYEIRTQHLRDRRKRAVSADDGLECAPGKAESLYPGRFPLRCRQHPVLSEYAGRLR